MKLFDEYPVLSDGVVCLKAMTLDDADALGAFKNNERVYRYLPTFLYEQRYEDPCEVLQKMHDECFVTHESLMLGVYLAENPETLVGIAEIYNYEEDRKKTSIGVRLDECVWGKGIATRIVRLLKDYLIGRVGIRIITSHVMVENTASAAVMRKSGFMLQDVDYHVLEDWGFKEPVIVDKFVFVAYGD
ncbi:MAG: GNAT family N-acetyltransferase [Eggerthellaceae bacterium]|nr:GNAT family N-acetyltransferase [Eggerthellaceae bacterium]